ncbi:MAG: type II toxin-antitoxin system Phd/YefM family antitoxin [Gemmatimonadaceae bacterium]
MANSRKAVPSARWALQDAKNRLSEVVDAALRGHPQVVTRRGVETAVVISHEQYTRMTTASREQRASLADYLLDGPAIDDSELFGRIVLRPRARV